MTETRIDVALDPRSANAGSEQVVAALHAMVQEARTASQATVAASDAMVRAFQRPAAPAIQAATGIRAAYNSLNDPFVNVTNRMGSLTDRVVNLRNAVAAGVFAALIHEAVDVSTRLEGVQDRMRAITRDFAAGARESTFAAASARELGIEIISTSDAYGRLVAATQGTALAGQKTRDIFIGISEAAKALELDTGQTGAVFDSLVTLMNRGEGTARQFQQQIGRQLPGSLQIAAKSLGVTTEEFNRMLVRGEVIAEDLLPKFAAELHKTFGPQAQAEASDLESEVTRLKGSFENLVASVTNTGTTGSFFRMLDRFVSGLAIAAGNAQDPLDALELRIRDIDKELRTLASQGASIKFGPDRERIDRDTARLMAERAELIRQQQKAFGVGEAGVAPRVAPVTPAKYTTDQLQLIEDLKRSLDKQSESFAVNARAGMEDARAMDVLNIRYTLLGKSIKEIPDDISAALTRLDRERQKVIASEFNRSIEQDTEALRIQAAAGDDASTALTRYQLEIGLSNKGLRELTPEIRKNIEEFLKQRAVLTASNVLTQLQHETEEYRLQAQSITDAAEAIEDLNRRRTLRQGGVTGADSRIEQAVFERKQAQNAAVLAEMEDQLQLSGMSEAALNREMALRKLNSEATEEQRQRIQDLADEQYKQMNGFGAYAKRVFEDVDNARDITMTNFVDSLADAAARGKFTFRGFAESVLSDLARIYARAMIVNAAMAAFDWFTVGGSGKMPAGGASSVPGAGGGYRPGPGTVAAALPSTMTRSVGNYVPQSNTPISTTPQASGGGATFYVTVNQANNITTKGVTAEEVQGEVARGVDKAVQAAVVTVQAKWKNGRL